MHETPDIDLVCHECGKVRTKRLTFAVSHAWPEREGDKIDPPHEHRAVFMCYCGPTALVKKEPDDWAWRARSRGHAL